ncbi:MAG TPA: rhodanese-like domain-containing protein [Kangiella sp.]|uniref:rhodanese-like domain-containing protein n=1 Tax=Kangiella sp. TaxID=1920245 RepID=UPI002F94F78B
MQPCLQNYIGNIKQNIKEISVDDFKNTDCSNALVIDVRESTEHAEGIIEGALPIPRGVLEFKLFNHPEVKDLSEDEILNKPVYIYCASGGRSACCAHALEQIGFKNVFSIAGGVKQWAESGGKLIKP